MALQTSGVLTTTAWDTRTLYDRAYGTLGLTPQQITGEKIDIAHDVLGMILADMLNTSVPLWCLQKTLITMVNGQKDYTLPVGTSDVRTVLNKTLANVTPTTVTTTPSAITWDFGLNPAGTNNDTAVTSVSVTWLSTAYIPLVWQSSEDSVNWTTCYSSTVFDLQNNIPLMSWYDMSNANAQRYWRVIPATSLNGQAITPANTLANIATAQLFNTPSSIQMYRMNIDDYLNLPNKNFPNNRPLQFWLNRALQPRLDVWPVPNAYAAANSCMEVHRERHIMDVGSLQQSIEVPTRWFYTVVMMLGAELALCTPEAKPDRVQLVIAKAEAMKRTTWTEERDKSPFKMNFGLRQYTR